MAISIGDCLLKLGLDASDLDKETQEAMNKFKTNLKIAGAAITGLGVGFLKIVGDAKQLSAQLGQTGLTLGITSDEMRHLALATTDVSFPLKDVADTFDLLVKAGIRDVTILKETARAFSTLSDITGDSAEILADELVPAYKALGLAIPSTTKELDKFTWLTKNTTVSISDFSSAMGYLAVYGQQLNITIDDMVAIMAALEARGISGAMATRKFRTAITEAVSSGKDLFTVLGIAKGEIDAYKGKLADATGITEQYSEVANTQYGILDKLKQKWSELTFAMGANLTNLEPLFVAMSALGPVMIFLGSSVGATTVKLMANTAALVVEKMAAYAAATANVVFNTTLGALGLLLITVTAAIALMNYQLGKGKDELNTSTDAVTGLDKSFKNLEGSSQAGRDALLQMAGGATETSTAIDELDELFRELTKSQQEIIDQDKQLKEAFKDLWVQLQYNNSESGKYRITMEDVYDALFKMGKTQEEIQSLFERFGTTTESLNEIMALYGLTAEQVATITGKLTTQIDSATASQIDYAKAVNESTKAQAGWIANMPTPHNDAEMQAWLENWEKRERELNPGYGGGQSGIKEMQYGGIIREPTLLSRLSNLRPYAIAGEAGPERVSPMGAGVQTANITIFLDGRVIGRVIGQPLIDELRVKTGMKL